MKTNFRNEGDNWIPNGRKITLPSNLEIIRRTMEDEGPIIVEHWFYRGGRTPDRFIFDDYDAFINYLNKHAFAGDALHVWSFAAVCMDENTLVSGKYPDEQGLIPQRGIY